MERWCSKSRTVLAIPNQAFVCSKISCSRSIFILCRYTLSHYSFWRLVVHAMNADYSVCGFLWFSTTKGKRWDRP